MVGMDSRQVAAETQGGNMQLSPSLPWDLAQTKWASILNPIIALPILQGNLVSDIVLKASTAQVINHGLQRQPKGWFLVDNTANAVIWRTAWSTLTITLTASANTTVAIWVF